MGGIDIPSHPQRDAAPERDQLHERRLVADRLSFNAERDIRSERSQKAIVQQRKRRIRPHEQKGPAFEIVQRYFLLDRERIGSRQGHEQLFVPECLRLAALDRWGTGQKHDIDPTFMKRPNLDAHLRLDELEDDIGADLVKSPDDLHQAIFPQRECQPDPKKAGLGETGPGHLLRRLDDPGQRISRRSEELLPGEGQANTGMISQEERRADGVLDVADATAERGLLNPERRGGATEAALLGRGGDKAQMANCEEIHPSLACRLHPAALHGASSGGVERWNDA